jgi:uncharacterized protein (TIGR02996 family)
MGLSDREAFLAAIRATPDEDTPRLVFADWLDEQGDRPSADWAKLIRLQVEAARHPLGTEGFAEARWNEEQHVRACLDAWTERRRAAGIEPWDFSSGEPFSWVGPLPGKVVVGGFVRGVPTSTGRRYGNYYDWKLLPEHYTGMARVVERFPVYRLSSALVGCQARNTPASLRGEYPRRGHSSLERIARWAPLAKFTALDISTGGSSAHGDNSPGLLALASSGFAANLTELGLVGQWISADALRAVAESARMSKVEHLALGFNWELLAAEIGWLAATPMGSRLRSFSCLGSGCSADDLTAILRAGRIERLAVTADPMTGRSAGVGGWLSLTNLSRLRSLQLHYEGPAAYQDRSPRLREVAPVPGLLELLASRRLPNLTELSLTGIDLREAGVRALVATPTARRLLTLELKRCRLTNACVPLLRPLLAEGKLRKLSLYSNRLTLAAAKELASWPELGRLHELELPGIEMGSKAVDLIDRSPHRHPFLWLSE